MQQGSTPRSCLLGLQLGAQDMRVPTVSYLHGVQGVVCGKQCAGMMIMMRDDCLRSSQLQTQSCCTLYAANPTSQVTPSSLQ